MAEKSNIQHLRDILNEFKEDMGEDYRNEKIEEADEFLDAIEYELKKLEQKDDEITRLESELDDKETEIRVMEEEAELANVEELGLDTLRWELDKGNLRLSQEMENFVDVLKKKYIGVTA